MPQSILRMTLVVLCCATLTACVTPLPIGPGRVKVNLERVELVEAPRRVLFQPMEPSATDGTTREAIKFVFTSETDLHRYFQHKIIQFRCRVERDGADYSGWGTGPYYEDTHLSLLPPSAQLEKIAGAYQYSAYAFVDLDADTGLVDGSFTRAPLDQLRFNRLSCFVIGVNKAPVLFPRSNNLVLSYEDFMSRLRDFRANASGG